MRVGFQRPPASQGVSEAEFQSARRQVILLAQRWQEAVTIYLESQPTAEIGAAEFLRSGIALAFPDDLILEAPDANTLISGDEHRSPFLAGDSRLRTYDVLVSLERLPLNRVDPFRAVGPVPKDVFVGEQAGVDRISMPVSELGSYARRMDYGLPTIYLGPFGAALKKPLLEYLTSPLGEHVVVHEFGHVLGLPHEHQNPNYPDTFYRDVPAMRDNVIKVFHVNREDVSERDIVEHVVGRWPGSVKFSDWPAPNSRSLYELDSVMTYPFHQEMLKPDLNPKVPEAPYDFDTRLNEICECVANLGRPAGDGDSSRAVPQGEGFKTFPTPSDAETLVRMYAPFAYSQYESSRSTKAQVLRQA